MPLGAELTRASAVLLALLMDTTPSTRRLQRRLARRHAQRILRTGPDTDARWFGAPVCVLETTGRRSGQPRRTPVLHLDDGDRLVLLAANGGTATDPGWWLNLRHDPRARIGVAGGWRDVRAREADGHERERLWTAFAQMYPAADDYARRTTRRIPVVVLEPHAVPRRRRLAMDNPEPDEHRVEFDFELEFTNGGALQGQGFRLDIDGDDISDDDLGAYIVSDLRLLMVGDVRIVNKRILRERHKRAKAAATPGRGDGGRTRVDLSHDVEDGMITFPGLPGPRIGEVLTHAEIRSRYAGGTEFQIGEIAMVANTGTYVDSPFHRYADREDVAALSLDRVADVDAVVVNVAGTERRAVDRRLLLPFDVADKAVLVHTGWDRRWGTDAYVEGAALLDGGRRGAPGDQRSPAGRRRLGSTSTT
jgi:arylformamidase